MSCVDSMRGLVLLAVSVSLIGCAALPPQPSPDTQAPPTAAAKRAEEPAIPPAASARYEAALAALKAGKFAEAEPALRALTREYPKLSGPYANLGILYFRQAKLTLAAEMLGRAIELNPSQAGYFNQLGIVHRHAGEFAKAREAYEEALALDPLHAEAQLNLGILHDLYLWEPSRALSYYQRYLELHPRDDMVQKWIVDISRRKAGDSRVSRKEAE
jgi:tetratricopeptide (TPR) repeat protein